MLEVARQAGVGRPTVWRWQQRFAEEGLDGLLRDKTRPPGKLATPQDEVQAVLERTLTGEPPGEATHWNGRAMAALCGLSLTTVQRIWRSHHLQPHRVRTFKRSPTNASSDPFTVTFSQAVTGVQASNFTLSGTDGTGTIGTPTTTDGVTYTVPVTGVSGNGTLGLNLSSTTGIASASTGTALGGTHASDSDYTIDTTLSTATIAFAASNSGAGAVDVNAAHAASAGYTVGSVDADATATVLFTGTLKSTGASSTVTGDGTNGSHTVDLSGFRDGTVTASIADQDTASNTRMGTKATTTLDITPPTIATLADSGPGIDANGNGDLGAGKTVTLTVTTSEAVTVTPGAGGTTPTLTLNDGGVATYTGGSGTAQQTFSYTVGAGQNTANLAVQGVNANGATVTDAAGNPLNSSLMGAAVPSGALVIDTTVPVGSSPTDTVAQNSGPTPIGITAPSDNLTAAGSLAIAAGTLPTDGTVTLASGTPVVSGQALTAAQLTGLLFTPTPGLSNQGSTFTYTVTGGAGNATQGTAALNVGAAGAPTIRGTHATADGSEAPVAPFSGVTVLDPSSAAGATETLTIALTGQGGTLSGTGLTQTAEGSYQLAGTAAQVTQQLDALSFTPTAGAPGTTTNTTFVLTDRSSAGTSVVDSGTSVADTAAPAPTSVPIAPGSGGVVGVAPADVISISPQVSYDGSAFTITGTASSASGVRSVEISAVVDGAQQDLGAATVAANGTFSFKDVIGAHTQGFITATETDAAGGTASAQANYSLQGGLSGGRGEQTRYSADGSVVAATDVFKADGSRQADITTGGQTLHSGFFDTFQNNGAPDTTFVFDPGFGRDVVDLFRVDGADHDTLSFKGSDYGNDIATVLASAHNTKAGLLITDPVASSPGGGPGTHDTLLLKGITKQQLAANQGDIAFHA